MRRNATTAILVSTALAATVVSVASGSAAGAAPQGGCTPTWRQVPVNYSDYRTPTFGAVHPEIGTLDPPIPGAVSALSSTDVRLAGNHGGWDPLLQRWTGKAIDPAPHQLPIPPGFEDFAVAAQSFSSPDEGWALASTILNGHGGQSHKVAYRWHGGRWTMVPTAAPANPLTHGTRPLDVVSVAATDAWSVGNRFVANPNSPGGAPAGVHIEHWDGTRWSIVDNPMATAPDSVLVSVTALASNNIWAVGWQSDGAGSLGPLVMRWDGTQWRTVSTPAVAKPAGLRGISGTGPNDIWAVGSYTKPGTTIALPLVQHWNGTQWRVVEVPDVGNARYHAVYAASPTSVWAVGEFPYAADAYFLHWDGRVWSKVRPPGAASGVNLRDLYLDIHGSGPNDVWAVGVHNNHSTPSGWKPLVARLSCGRF